MAVGAREHVVVLIPGFLPFANGTAARGAGGASCHVATVLRSAIEAFYGLTIPVVTLAHLPTLDLAKRQRVLLQELQALDGALRGVRHFHLVGHGPGGLDAELLTAQYPLKPSATWLDLDPTHLRERIASVVTIGAPHQGTQLLEVDPQLAAASSGSRAARLRHKADLLAAVAQRMWFNLQSQGRDSLHSMALLARGLRLLGDKRARAALAPSHMQALRARNRPDTTLSVHVENVVVVAPDLPFEQAGVTRGSDKLFAALHALTARCAASEPSLNLSVCARMLRAVPTHRIVKHASARLPGLDLSANDGLVNAAHQITLTRSSHQNSGVLAIAIADHADVIGYHESDGPWSAQTENFGLFRSGANFGDDEFFQLWGHIAAQIANIARQGAGATPTFGASELAAQ